MSDLHQTAIRAADHINRSDKWRVNNCHHYWLKTPWPSTLLAGAMTSSEIPLIKTLIDIAEGLKEQS